MLAVDLKNLSKQDTSTERKGNHVKHKASLCRETYKEYVQKTWYVNHATDN